MKITSATSIQAEPKFVDYAAVKSQATSSGSMNKIQDETDQKKSAPIKKGNYSDNRSQGVDAEELEKNVRELNEQMKFMNRSIQFSIDGKSKDVVVKIVDKSSGEVISQIPPEEVLKLRERMQEMAGIIVEKTV